MTPLLCAVKMAPTPSLSSLKTPVSHMINCESHDHHHTVSSSDQDKMSQFEVKLMDIDSEHLGIPVRSGHVSAM